MQFIQLFYVANTTTRDDLIGGLVLTAGLAGIGLWTMPDVRRRRQHLQQMTPPAGIEDQAVAIAIGYIDPASPPPPVADPWSSDDRGWAPASAVPDQPRHSRDIFGRPGATADWSPMDDHGEEEHSGEFTALDDLPARPYMPATRVPRSGALERDVERVFDETLDPALEGSRARLRWLGAADQAPPGRSRAAYRAAAGADDTQAIDMDRVRERMDAEQAADEAEQLAEILAASPVHTQTGRRS